MGIVTCFYEGVVALLHEVVVACLDDNNKDNFDVYTSNIFDKCFE